MRFDKSSHQGMTHFVISDQALASAIGQGLTLHASDDPIDSIIDLTQADCFLAAASREDCGFIEKVGQICAGESRRSARNALQGQVLVKLFVAGMHLEDGEATLDIWGINSHLTIETTRAHESRVENVRTVGGGENNDAAVSLKAVHLGEQLVKGLLTLIVAAANTCTALTSHCVDLVDEDQTRAVFFGAFEQIAHPAGTNTNKHLHKFRTGEGEEGNTCFTSDGLGEKRFARSGRAYQQHSFGNLRSNRGETLWLLQEGDHFLKILFCF